MSILSASGRWPKIAEVNERGFDRRFKRVFYRHGYNRLRKCLRWELHLSAKVVL